MPEPTPEPEERTREFAVIVEVDGTMVVPVEAVDAEEARRKVDAMIDDGSAFKLAEDLELQRVTCTAYVEES